MEMETREVIVDSAGVPLPAFLTRPAGSRGLVIFVHGSGSSRFSTRNRFVADLLARAGLATLLFDLLTEEEGRLDAITAELRFDISLLTERTMGTLDWVAAELEFGPPGLFGASTGAAAALGAAAMRPDGVAAVVSRGGRPDLAIPLLPRVEAPTLFIVGELDTVVLELNRKAAAVMRAPWELAIVPGATHLFEEPGTLEQAAGLARDWFLRHLLPEATG
ncbi:MAG TPA: alpha/beta hydrolase [Thiolapillus brandeum]|uniref:Alpha/beta hydrolase n=1 Tax=Thiolapillus brandeum TaxID=1076588 RepID=A0A7C5IZG2_9GAMM|nr:alpha/beta hydrolase [Thiolapillus brandeum]